MQHVEVSRVIAAPIETVWARYTDHRSMSEWAGLGSASLDRQGSPDPNGVGCIRVFSTLGFKVYEEVVRFEPPKHMTYRLIRGAVPMRNHLGEVDFETENGGTRVTWRCQFEPGIPGLGGFSQKMITRLFRKALDGLARTLEN